MFHCNTFVHETTVYFRVICNPNRKTYWLAKTKQKQSSMLSVSQPLPYITSTTISTCLPHYFYQRSILTKRACSVVTIISLWVATSFMYWWNVSGFQCMVRYAITLFVVSVLAIKTLNQWQKNTRICCAWWLCFHLYREKITLFYLLLTSIYWLWGSFDSTYCLMWLFNSWYKILKSSSCSLPVENIKL